MNKKINKAAVLGAGTMGAGIAAHLAGAGLTVHLLDMVPRELTPGEEKKGLTLKDKAVRNRLAQKGKDFATDQKAHIKLIYEKSLGDNIQVGNFEDDIEVLADCDWIIEVIVERLDIKQQMMNTIAAHRKEGSIVSTNTSGISVNAIAEGQSEEFKQHFLGTHFFNPVRVMKLLEIIPGNDTLPEVTQFLEDFGTMKLGKGIVVAKDSPNFIANRIGTYHSLNALNKVKKYGFNVAEVDAIMGGLFKTMDLVGLDISYHTIGSMMSTAQNEEEKELFKIPEFITVLVERGNLGLKTGAGLYKKADTPNGKQKLMLNLETLEYVPVEKRNFPMLAAAAAAKTPEERNELLYFGEDEVSRFNWEVLRDDLLYAAKYVNDVASSYEDVDHALEWGFNVPMGHFKLWDFVGFDKVLNKMLEEGADVAQWVLDRADQGQHYFYQPGEAQNNSPYIIAKSDKYKTIIENESAVLKDIGDGVACFIPKTKGNAIDSDLNELLSQSIDEVEKNYKGLVIGNNAKNFSVGANLTSAETDLNQSTRDFQNVTMKIKYSTVPIVSAVGGRALGGGAEIVLHSAAAVAHAESNIGLVEVGVGLIPSGGGTKELALLAMGDSTSKTVEELAHSLMEPLQKILFAQVTGSAFEAKKSGYLREQDRIIMNKDSLLDDAKAKVLEMYNDGYRPKTRGKMIKAAGRDGIALLNSMVYAMYKNGYLSEYDLFLAQKLAYILSGGDVVGGTLVPEEHFLNLERETFVALSKEDRTLARIEHMLTTGRPLRN